MKKTVLYIGNFSFPFGNASGKRVFGNGKLLESLGYCTVFIGMDEGVDQEASLKDTELTYQGFKYYNLSYPRGSREWLTYKKTFNKVIDFLNSEKIANTLFTVIYYGSPRLSIFNSLLIKWCQKNNIKVVSDCVDWLASNTGNIPFDLIKWSDTTYQKSYLNKKVDGVIAISSFLGDYYKKYDVKTIIIPPVSTNKNLGSYQHNGENKIKLLYAGIPFRKSIEIKDNKFLKDRIDKTIILLSEMKDIDFTFNIYGFTKEEYLKVIPKQEKYIDTLKDNIVFHGHQENNKVIEELIKSDFTILLRDKKKDTMAGFPTKVSESMSFGVPVITTQTSDLSKYIRDGDNGFFLDMDNEHAAIKKLRLIFSLNRNEIDEIKRKCIVEDQFYYANFKTDLKTFLGEI